MSLKHKLTPGYQERRTQRRKRYEAVHSSRSQRRCL